MRNHTRNRRLLTRNRRFLCVLIAIAACGAAGSHLRASVAPDTSASDEAAVRENLRQMEAASDEAKGVSA